MKKITALLVAVAVLSLTACKSEEFCNLVSFTQNFNENSQLYSLSHENYIIENNNTFYAFFPQDEPVVVLKLQENEQGKLEKVSVTLGKYDSGAKIRALSEKDNAVFYEVIKTAVAAFTNFESEECKSICDEFFLSDLNTIKKQGEMNKTQNAYHFVYYSNSLVSMFTVTNTWLCEVEKTEKPESKPYFGNTTNLNGESIKLN